MRGSTRMRRAAVWVAVLAVLAGGGGCLVRVLTRWPSVTLLANWTGVDEQKLDTQVIQPFERRYRVRVSYQGTTAESQVLKADVESGTPPDVAVLPGSGELAGYARLGELRPLDSVVDPARFDPALTQALTVGTAGPAHYWVPVKEDLKSIVWHPASLSGTALAAAAGDPARWCLGMGADATSGWPGTDWVEDILLQQSGRSVYQAWATGHLSWTDPRVERAWRTWGAMVGAGRREEAERALNTPFESASARAVGSRPGCALEHQASFIRDNGYWNQVAGGAGFTPSAGLIPGAASGVARWEVSGDLAGMFHDSPAARALIRYLASARVQTTWSTAESGFSADTAVTPAAYAADPLGHAIAARLRATSDVRCFDASDAMPPVMRDAFTQTALEYLADPGDLSRQLAALRKVSEGPQVEHHWLPSVCA